MTNETDLISILPQEFAEKASFFVTILKAIGAFLVIYVIYIIIIAILNKKRNKEIRKINENLEEIKMILKKKKK